MMGSDGVDFRSRSFWMETPPYEPGQPLDGDKKVDVAIVGGGFGGLWTAYQLKRAEPSLNIAIVEKEVVGYGASGRNGGMVTTLVARNFVDLVEAVGKDEARSAHIAMAEAVDGIGQFCQEHSVDCDYEKNGILTVSTAPWQDATIQADLEVVAKLGIDDVRYVDGPALREMVHSPGYRCGHEEKSSAILNPAKLAWGLARVLRGQGVDIYENTPVQKVKERAGGAEVETARGTVHAKHLVMTTNAYSPWFPMFRHWVIPIYTYIVLTEPLTANQWKTIGWAGRHGIEDRMGGFHYYRPTADNRILWGGEVYPYHYGSSVHPRFDRHEGAFEALRESFKKTFPPLADIKFTHAWGGPVGITWRFIATFGTTKGGHIHHGVGHCGHGVSTTYLGGEILRDLVLGRETDRTNLCFVSKRPISLPPEPLRYLVTNWSLKEMKDQDRKGRAMRASVLERSLTRRHKLSELDQGG